MIRTTLAAVAAMSVAVSAHAHSEKEATLPADGATVAGSPAAVGMTFDMPMRVTSIRLTDASGAQHPLVRDDGMAPVSQFAATPPDLPAGAYTVEWRGIANDGHSMGGAFSFTVE